MSRCNPSQPEAQVLDSTSQGSALSLSQLHQMTAISSHYMTPGGAPVSKTKTLHTRKKKKIWVLDTITEQINPENCVKSGLSKSKEILPFIHEVEVTQSCLTLCNPMDCSLPGSSVHGNSPGKNPGVGCSFLQGSFPTQGSNPGFPHCWWILYCLSLQGSSFIHRPV